MPISHTENGMVSVCLNPLKGVRGSCQSSEEDIVVSLGVVFQPVSSHIGGFISLPVVQHKAGVVSRLSVTVKGICHLGPLVEYGKEGVVYLPVSPMEGVWFHYLSATVKVACQWRNCGLCQTKQRACILHEGSMVSLKVQQLWCCCVSKCRHMSSVLVFYCSYQNKISCYLL